MKGKPLVSVVVPAYNAANNIEATLASVLQQTFTDWECIIADDCSTDKTLEYIRRFMDRDSRFKLVQSSVNGLTASARNLALEVAQGKYIAFIDADDRWLPQKIEKQLKFMQEGNYAFTFHAFEHISGDGTPLNTIIPAERKLEASDLFMSNLIGCLTVMYDASKVGKVEMKEGFHTREDLICWIEILEKVGVGFGLNEVLAQYRVHAGASTHSKLKSASSQWNFYRKYLKLPFWKSLAYLSVYTKRGFVKHRSRSFPR